MRSALLWLATILSGGVLSVLAAEALLRATGHAPVQLEHPNPTEPAIHDRDPELGWRSRPGRHVFPPYRLPGEPFVKTILPDGRRATAPDDGNGRPQIAVVGGSYTMGWAIGDADTWPWRVQELLPEHRVMNFAVSGYGTYQSLLLLERELPHLSAPRHVVYGIIQHHKSRNVADAAWLRTLDLLTRGEAAAVPYVTLDRHGELVRHPPLAYPRTWLRDHSAIVHLLTRLAFERHPRERMPKLRVLEALLREMARVSDAHGARLWVALLEFQDPSVEQNVREILAREGIGLLDCSQRLVRGLRVPGQGHPNARAHRRWGDCIAGGLRAQGVASEPSAAPVGAAGLPGPGEGGRVPPR
jgi:hypothetical protein